jgi:hypothetical protein
LLDNDKNPFYHFFLSLQKYNFMEYYNAIIFFKPEKKLAPRKYRNIGSLDNFINFAKKSDGHYINFYHKKTKDFFCRKYVNE